MREKLPVTPLALVSLAAICGSCGEEPKPSPKEPPVFEESRVDEEAQAEQDTDHGSALSLFGLSSGREELRQQARKMTVEKYPSATIHGVSTIRCSGNTFFVGVDAGDGDGRQTINLLARRFYDDEGQNGYWKLEQLTAWPTAGVVCPSSIENNIEVYTSDY